MKNVQKDQSDYRIPTPELVNVVGCVEYNESAEKAFAARQRDLRSEKTDKTASTTPVAPKKKRRRKCRTRWTRPKRSQSSMKLSSSAYSRADSRSAVSYAFAPSPYSNLSECSTRHNGTRTNLSTVILRDWNRPLSDLWCGIGYYCTEKGCGEWFTNIDILNLHKVVVHRLRNVFFCTECHKKYTSKSELIIHAAIHDRVSIFCPMCGEEFINAVLLQRHFDQHMLYSIPCDYCDLMFLSKEIRDVHQRKMHRYNRVPKEPLPRFVFKQVTYRKFESNGIFPWNNQSARVNGKKNDVGFCNYYFIMKSRKVLNSEVAETIPELCT